MFSTSGSFSAARRAIGTAATTVSITGFSTTTVFGTAPAGATVTVSRGGTVLGTAIANGSGAWSYTPATPPAPGDVYTASVPVASPSFTVPGTPASSSFRFDSTSARFDATTLTFDKAA